MRRLSLGEFAQIAEIVAAVAVVVSLVYVGIGLRDNTFAVRSASAQAVTNTSLDILFGQATNADLSHIRIVGDDDYSALTEEEKYRYYLLYRPIWLSWQNVYLQQELGVIDPKLWGTYERVICATMDKPGVQESWHIHSSVLDPGFVALAEACSSF